jgi:transposase, IS5 family
MYRQSPTGQLSFENFYLPFGGKLSGENRWVRLAELVPWEQFESEYAEQFSEGQGAPAKPFRMALGALIIKEKLGISDEETVEQIRENPYLQYFLGISEYSDKAPFEASMMVHFRKRLNLEIVGRINERIVKPPKESGQREIEEKQDKKEEQKKKEEKLEEKDVEKEQKETEPANQGKLLLDATVAPSDIRYPTDIKLLNEAREQTEIVIDALYQQVKEQLPKKPRTYRREARTAYLQIAKQRKPNSKKIRKAMRQQLGYVRRNLAHIDTLIAAGAKLSELKKNLYRNLLVVSEVYRQQQLMYGQGCHRIDNRIVSITQPHVRPIVRGKSGTPVEFGAKLSVSCVDGHAFLDHLSWDNFNESGDLQQQIELFKSRFGHYPEAVYVDQIYRTRSNRAYCRNLGIRITAPPLGRPVPDDLAAIRKQTLEDAKVRNQIEGKFGQAKRRFSLNRVMTKLANTSETAIAITFLVMNLEALLKQLAFLFFSWFMIGRQRLFLTFDKAGFTFSAIFWQFPILTSNNAAFSRYLLLAT